MTVRSGVWYRVLTATSNEPLSSSNNLVSPTSSGCAIVSTSTSMGASSRQRILQSLSRRYQIELRTAPRLIVLKSTSRAIEGHGPTTSPQPAERQRCERHAMEASWPRDGTETSPTGETDSYASRTTTSSSSCCSAGGRSPIVST